MWGVGKGASYPLGTWPPLDLLRSRGLQGDPDIIMTVAIGAMTWNRREGGLPDVSRASFRAEFGRAGWP